MSFFRCPTCSGTYQDPQPDGSTYFHVCPLIPNKAVQPDPAKPNFDPREQVERDGHRDENIVAALEFTEGKYVVTSRDPHDAAILLIVEVKELAKKPGKPREAI